MYKLKKLVALLLNFTFLIGIMHVYTSAQEIKTEMKFDVITEVLEFGFASRAIVIDTNGTVKADDINAETFSITCENYDYGGEKLSYSGVRNISEVYVNNSGEADNAGLEEGRYIVIELQVSHVSPPNSQQSASTAYNGETMPMQLNFFIKQNNDVIVSGTSLKADEIRYLQNKVINLIVDDFIDGQGEDSYPYKLYIPDKSSNSDKYPLVIWLHGGGEGGTTAFAQMLANKGPTAFAAKSNQENYPSYVLAPQTTGRDKAWENGEKVVKLIEEIIGTYQDIDRDRIYIVGGSMGGLGTMRTLLCNPDLFAGAIVTCPAFNLSYNIGPDITTELAETIKDVPVWLFHCQKDGTVPVDVSRNLYSTMLSAGCNVRYTEFETVTFFGHASWVPVLENYYSDEYNEYVFDWLYSHENKSVDSITVDNTSSAGADFTITVKSLRDDILGFQLENENGGKLTIKSISSVKNEDGTTTWNIKTSVGTSGQRTLSLIPISMNVGKLNKVEFSITIIDDIEPNSIVSASFSVKAAAKDSNFKMIAHTGRAVSKLSIKNEKGSNIGKKLISKVRNNDGTINWEYSTSVSTSGERVLSVIANDIPETAVMLPIIIVQ